MKGDEGTLSHRPGVAARRGPPFPQLDKQETCYLHCAYQIRGGENGLEMARQKEALLRHFCCFTEHGLRWLVRASHQYTPKRARGS